MTDRELAQQLAREVVGKRIAVILSTPSYLVDHLATLDRQDVKFYKEVSDKLEAEGFRVLIDRRRKQESFDDVAPPLVRLMVDSTGKIVVSIFAFRGSPRFRMLAVDVPEIGTKQRISFSTELMDGRFLLTLNHDPAEFKPLYRFPKCLLQFAVADPVTLLHKHRELLDFARTASAPRTIKTVSDWDSSEERYRIEFQRFARQLGFVDIDAEIEECRQWMRPAYIPHFRDALEKERQSAIEIFKEKANGD